MPPLIDVQGQGKLVDAKKRLVDEAIAGEEEHGHSLGTRTNRVWPLFRPRLSRLVRIEMG